jgi:hypothetical protein
VVDITAISVPPTEKKVSSPNSIFIIPRHSTLGVQSLFVVPGPDGSEFLYTFRECCDYFLAIRIFYFVLVYFWFPWALAFFLFAISKSVSLCLSSFVSHSLVLD